MTIEAILAKFGPMTTSRATKILEEHGCSPTAARQRVSRRSRPVLTLHGLPFPKRARFIYLESQFGTDDYWSALIEAIDDANPAYAAALAGLRARGGICLREHFDIISGSPLKQRGQLASSVVLARLKSVRLIHDLEIEGIGRCVALTSIANDSPQEIKRLRATLATEAVLLDAIRSWAGRMNMASPNATRIRNEDPAPQFSTFCFDVTGPSYLHPLVKFSGSTLMPGFFVADVLLAQELDERMVRAFLRKCAMLAAIRGVRPFLPMLIGDSFTREALRMCRSKGVMTTRPDTLFGQDVAKALEDLVHVLTHKALVTPARIENLFGKLSAIEGSAGNLRGALFELIVGHCVGEVEGGSVDIGSLVSDTNGKWAEIDVLLSRQRTVKIYECKGYQPTSTVRRTEVETWVSEKIPTIYRALKQDDRFGNAVFTFEFWTSSSFEEDSLDLLRTAKAATRKYEINWKSGQDIRTYAQGLSAPGLKKILDDHYLNHPTVRAIRQAERSERGGQRKTMPDAPNGLADALPQRFVSYSEELGGADLSEVSNA